ncbi:hypothetical protein [Paraburkholderia sp. BCC1884]|uniref:hypothetical protein n=1 Tax=Paraburkholderia sp. BCC1884 TaxID=2562668 RepID=UPI0011843C1E|nr:hypothetical protein [Paraburkholderia sp. BCC1884]
MSRYFKIVITDPKTGYVFAPNVNGRLGFSLVKPTVNTWTYSSLYTDGTLTKLGSSNPSALKVEFDIPVSFLDQPIGNPYIQISGVSLQEMSQGANLNRMNIAVYGGMAKGLPLANPAQAGLLCSGQITQAFGNWVGTSQTLSIYVQAGGSSPSSNQTTGNPSGNTILPAPTTSEAPANIVFQWKAGQPLLVPLMQTLQLAFPQYTISGAISPNLVWSGATATGFYSKLSQFATYINKASINLISGYAPGTDYMGVKIALQDNTILITDGTTQTAPKLLMMQDLIGQPTYGQPLEIQALCVLRGDIKVGSYVTLPPGPLTIQQGGQTGAIAPPPQGSINTTAQSFEGTFMCTSVRHVGSSRDGGGTSWITALNLLTTAPGDAKAKAYALDVLQRPAKNRYGFYVPGQL